MPRSKRSQSEYLTWLAKHNTKHGMTKSPEYNAWRGIKRRCYDPKFKQYNDYGGRGIRMCDEWLNSFDIFYADMGPRPKGYSIDRINNDGNYTPDNCRWATKAEQARNRTDTRVLEFDGKCMTVAEWAIELNNPQLYNRLHRGWSIDRALLTPCKERPNAKKEKHT